MKHRRLPQVQQDRQEPVETPAVGLRLGIVRVLGHKHSPHEQFALE